MISESALVAGTAVGVPGMSISEIIPSIKVGITFYYYYSYHYCYLINIIIITAIHDRG
jgi:hypothetical protein